MDEKPKSKEQVLLEMKVQQDRKFVREKFFPLLCASTESIQDADYFLQSFSTMIMETFLGKMREMKFKDLKLTEKLATDSPQYKNITDLINLFGERSADEAQKLIDGMKDEIRLFYKEEMKTRKLESLKATWLGDDGAKESPYAGEL